MGYKVIISDHANSQFDDFLRYLLFNLKNEQAALKLLEDAEDTMEALSSIAGSLDYCRDDDLRAMGYRMIHFRRHRYLWIYQIDGDVVQVKAMYHELQDYENRFKSDL